MTEKEEGFGAAKLVNGAGAAPWRRVMRVAGGATANGRCRAEARLVRLSEIHGAAEAPTVDGGFGADAELKAGRCLE